MNTFVNRKTKFIHLGLTDYKQAWDYQAGLFEKTLAVKSSNRDLPADRQTPTDNYLIFCQHPHVYTQGKSGKDTNLLIKKDNLSAIGASYYHINRGGDITYHGPGQLVCYPVLDLENFFTDIHQYMRFLEESVIQTLRRFTIDADRVPGLTGVWVHANEKIASRKICAMGVKMSRWVTMHGLALNINPDLKYFENIIACGIEDKSVTSMKEELGTNPDVADVEKALKEEIGKQFKLDWV